MVTKSGKSDQKTISGTAGNDIINWIGDSNIFNLGDGNDRLNITGNSNLFYLGNGNDSVLVRGSSNVINSGNGDDSINISGNSNIIKGEAGSNTLVLNGNGNAISSFNAITILNASFGNRIYGNNAKAVLNGDTSARFEGNNNRIGSQGVTNIEIIGDGNLYNYDRNLTQVDPGISGLNYGIKVTGDNNKIIERGNDEVYKRYSESSSLNVTGNNNYIEAERATVSLNVETRFKNTVRGNDLTIDYSYFVTSYYDELHGLHLDGENIFLDLKPLNAPPGYDYPYLAPRFYLDGLVDDGRSQKSTENSPKSLTIRIDNPNDRFYLDMKETQNNKNLHKISVCSYSDSKRETLKVEIDNALPIQYAAINFLRGTTIIGTINYIKGNDDIYYNGKLIFDGQYDGK